MSVLAFAHALWRLLLEAWEGLMACEVCGHARDCIDCEWDRMV